jgi:hypothetical protein
MWLDNYAFQRPVYFPNTNYPITFPLLCKCAWTRNSAAIPRVL